MERELDLKIHSLSALSHQLAIKEQEEKNEVVEMVREIGRGEVREMGDGKLEELERINEINHQTIQQEKKRREEERNKTQEQENNKKRCVICLEAPPSLLFFPCRHVVCCEDCGVLAEIRDCPICRKKIDDKMKIFM